MTRRRLLPDEQALWRRVTDSVAPLHPASVPVDPSVPATPSLPAGKVAKTVKAIKARPGIVAPPPALPVRRASPALARATLDATWDRQLRRGMVRPDATIDLHGHTLASAHDRLDHAIASAVTRGARVLLIIAGRVRPGAERAPVHAAEARPRGVIRATLNDWLAASPHAAHFVATRPAHISHGGSGAIYLILRRDH